MANKLYKIKNPDYFSRVKEAYVFDDKNAEKVTKFIQNYKTAAKEELFKRAEDLDTDSLNEAYMSYLKDVQSLEDDEASQNMLPEYATGLEEATSDVEDEDEDEDEDEEDEDEEESYY